jgi:hypothetical protein
LVLYSVTKSVLPLRREDTNLCRREEETVEVLNKRGTGSFELHPYPDH